MTSSIPSEAFSETFEFFLEGDGGGAVLKALPATLDVV